MNDKSNPHWAKAAMAHRFHLKALDLTLKDLMKHEAPFGGKIVGDFRQTLPVMVSVLAQSKTISNRYIFFCIVMLITIQKIIMCVQKHSTQ